MFRRHIQVFVTLNLLTRSHDLHQKHFSDVSMAVQKVILLLFFLSTTNNLKDMTCWKLYIITWLIKLLDIEGF